MLAFRIRRCQASTNSNLCPGLCRTNRLLTLCSITTRSTCCMPSTRSTSCRVFGARRVRSKALEAYFISKALSAGSLPIRRTSWIMLTSGLASAWRISRVNIGRLGSCSWSFISCVTTWR
ncbi:hypothetical protein FQZ97_908960 [compost metagenome]